MSSQDRFESELRRRNASGLLDVLIRAGLILAMVVLCYQDFSPFLTLMVWAVILAVALYPLHQYLADKMGGKQGLTATILVVLGIAVGRGVDAPMPVILLGALGGMAAAGILGMFVGATLLALSYQIFMGWVAACGEVQASEQKQERPT